MAWLGLLSTLVSLVLVTESYFVTLQNEDPNLVECGENGFSEDVFPGRYNFPTIVRSYNFTEGPYRDNENCRVRFRTDDSPLLFNVTFNVFDLEAQTECFYDYLCVNGVDFCGNWEQGKSYSFLVPANNSFTLWFRSDVSVTGQGFQVTVVVDKAVREQHYLEVASGYGSSENLLLTELSDLNNYSDRCLITSKISFWQSTYSPYYYGTNYGQFTDPPYFDGTNYGQFTDPLYFDGTNYGQFTDPPYYDGTNYGQFTDPPYYNTDP